MPEIRMMFCRSADIVEGDITRLVLLAKIGCLPGSPCGLQDQKTPPPGWIDGAIKRQ